MPISQKQYHLIAFVLITAACLICYRRVVELGYVFDDYPSIVHNDFVKRGFDGLGDIFTTTLWKGNSAQTVAIQAYRPLTIASFAIGYELFGDNPAAFHVLQVIFYVLLCLLTYLTLNNLLPSNYRHIALLSALLFAVHPIHSEVVCNLKSRDELLSLLFSVASLYFLSVYLKSNEPRHKYAAALCLFLGFLSKETTITFLAIIPLSLYFFSSLRPIDIGKMMIPLLAAFALYMTARAWVFAHETNPWVPITYIQHPMMLAKTASEKIGTILYVNGKYLQLMLFPYELTHSYFYDDVPLVPLHHWKALAALAAYVLIFYYIIKNFKTKSLTVYGLLCYLLGLSIFSHTLPFLEFANTMGERLAFTMSWGFCIFLAALYELLQKQFRAKSFGRKFVPASVFGIILIGFAYRTQARVPEWKDNLTLSIADEKVSPRSYFINNHLFNHFYQKYLKERDSESFAKAMHHIETLCSLDSLRPSYYIKKGHLFLLSNQPTKADEVFKKAAFYQQNRGKDAFIVPEFTEKTWDVSKTNAYVDYPSVGYLYKHIGELYFHAKQYDKAAVYFIASLNLMDTEIGRFHAFKDIGTALLMAGEHQKSFEWLNKAYVMQPEDFDVNNGLGHVNFHLKNYEQSALHFEKAFKARPLEELLNNTLAVYQFIGNKEKTEYYTRIKEQHEANKRKANR